MVPYRAVGQVAPGPALVLAPHPDDEVLGCAGAILRHRAKGERVHVVVVTDGGGGGTDQQTAYVRMRREESERAALVLGCEPPTFWNLSDRGLAYGEELIGRISDQIRVDAAMVVYVPAPTEIHPDHSALSLAAIEAVQRDPRPIVIAFYEVGQPLQANLFLDITDLEAHKQQAIACFQSQLVQQRYDEQIAGLNRYRAYTLGAGVRAAEAYRVVSSAELKSNRAFALGPIPQPLRGPRRPAPHDSPLVSVIVRTRGRETLDEALASIAAQSWPSIEVIVVDAKGGLTLSMQSCGGFPIRMVGGEALSRTAAANAGLAAARGTHVVFLDDDDWFHPHHIAALQEALTSRRSARAAYAGVELVEVRSDGTRQRSMVYSAPYDVERLRCENYIPMHALMFERTLFCDDGCRFDESLTLCEDWDFWLQLSRRTTFLHVPEIGAAYRFPGGSPLYTPGAQAAAFSAIFEKWRALWTRDELYSAWSYVRQQRAALSAANQERAKLQAARQTHAEEVKLLCARLEGELGNARAEFQTLKQEILVLRVQLDEARRSASAQH